nr:uncharacterized protein LOC124222295 [Neodiprion pinetum]
MITKMNAQQTTRAVVVKWRSTGFRKCSSVLCSVMMLNDKPYGGDPEVEKQECVLHVKKRMYRALQGVKKTLTEYAKVKKQLDAAKNTKMAVKVKSTEESAPKKRRIKRDSSTSAKPPKPKPLQLTNKIMLKMSTYYGLAITRNCHSLEEMKKAVWATFYHMTSTDENPQHSYCSDSWCKYQQLKAENQESTYEHPVTFDEQVTNLIKPVYETLASDDLLKRCLGGNTQNNNESFNHCVWNFAPKHTFTGSGAASAGRSPAGRSQSKLACGSKSACILRTEIIGAGNVSYRM